MREFILTAVVMSIVVLAAFFITLGILAIFDRTDAIFMAPMPALAIIFGLALFCGNDRSEASSNPNAGNLVIDVAITAIIMIFAALIALEKDSMPGAMLMGGLGVVLLFISISSAATYVRKNKVAGTKIFFCLGGQFLVTTIPMLLVIL